MMGSGPTGKQVTGGSAPAAALQSHQVGLVLPKHYHQLTSLSKFSSQAMSNSNLWW